MSIPETPDPLCPSPHPDGHALCINCSLINVVREHVSTEIQSIARQFSQALRTGTPQRPLTLMEAEFERGLLCGMDNAARIARGES